MKIDAQNPQVAGTEAIKIVKGKKTASVEQRREQAGQTDRVELSGKAAEAAEVAHLQAARQEKVQSIKASIENGTYQVSARQVAEKMAARLTRNKQ